MGLHMSIPLPGPFRCSTRIGGRRRRHRGNSGGGAEAFVKLFFVYPLVLCAVMCGVALAVAAYAWLGIAWLAIAPALAYPTARRREISMSEAVRHNRARVTAMISRLTGMLTRRTSPAQSGL